MKKQLLLIISLFLLGSCGRSPKKHYPVTAQVGATRYHHLVRKAAKRYKIHPQLILAIIEVESGFNPRVVGFQRGFGLMQVVPSTAGRDVFKHLKKRSDQPTRRYLFDPSNNIDVGTAYLHLLQTRYLSAIKHPTTRQYAIIAAYNGGHGNLFRFFSHSPKLAIQAINQLSPKQFYQQVVKKYHLPYTRDYLAKVVQAQKRYAG